MTDNNHSLKKSKLMTAEAAAAVINDGDVVATDGFVGNGFAEEMSIAI